MHQKAVSKTAVVTPFGLYEFLRLSFGLKMQAAPSSTMWTGCNVACLGVSDIRMISLLPVPVGRNNFSSATV
jgi:hypothetical protein